MSARGIIIEIYVVPRGNNRRECPGSGVENAPSGRGREAAGKIRGSRARRRDGAKRRGGSSMKQMIRRRLCIVILTVMLLTLFLNYFLQIQSARSDMYAGALDKFRQIEQILDQNEQDTARAKQDLKQDCFIRAKAAAYILQDRPEAVPDQNEMKKIANLLQVDELHLFDTEGNLYAGSEPKYFGYNFDSGEQMRFFLPMLTDRSLELCQDITPNTAERKLMQYAAVWRPDGQGIVQIGLEPTRVLEAMKKNELSYIFSMVTADNGSAIYAVDPESYRILGATQEQLVGRELAAVGLTPEQVQGSHGGFKAEVYGVDSYCVFMPFGSVILGMTESLSVLYREVNRSTALVALYLILIALLMIVSISKYIDRYIVDGISAINRKLTQITNGNLETMVEEDGTPEFSELSGRINLMVRSILDNTNKLSQILDIARVPIGVYEYSQGMRRVMATSRVAEILGLTDDEAGRLFADHSLFEAWLSAIGQSPLDEENGVYILPGEPQRFVRLETYYREYSVLGLVVDVTEEIQERRRIERERDIDLLTGLYNRRAFYRRMEELFDSPGKLGACAMIMADADNLKQVNDRYGHENGDRYLQGVAGIFRAVCGENSVLARLSGDEFAAFLYGYSAREELEELIKALYSVMSEETAEFNGQERIPVRFSAGCAFYPEDGNDFASLLKRADAAMYVVKRERKQGRGNMEGS